MNPPTNDEVSVECASRNKTVQSVGRDSEGRRAARRAIVWLASAAIAGFLLPRGFACCRQMESAEGSDVDPPSGARSEGSEQSAGPNTVQPGGSATRGEPVALTDLSRDGRELKAAFNADRDAVKVLLIVSPTCPMCRSGAQLVQDQALARIGGHKPKVYVVWTKKLYADNRDAATKAVSLVPDRRARHFWDPSGYLGKQYGKTLDLPGGRRFAWDVYLIFDPKASWTDAPPAPSFWMHQLGGQKPESRLDGARFRDAIVQRLS
jgi:hypothetical protein